MIYFWFSDSVKFFLMKLFNFFKYKFVFCKSIFIIKNLFELDLVKNNRNR